MTREDARKLLRDFSLASEYHIAMVVDSWEREAISVAIKALEEPAQQWIPCSEKLPESLERVLVTFEDDGERFVTVGRLAKYRGFWNWDIPYSGHVIAWMPLPEPMRGEQE